MRDTKSKRPFSALVHRTFRKRREAGAVVECMDCCTDALRRFVTHCHRQLGNHTQRKQSSLSRKLGYVFYRLVS